MGNEHDHDHDDHDHDHDDHEHDHGEVGRIVHVSSGVQSGSCKDCGAGLSKDFAETVNHYLGHGGVLLHVGAEFDHDDEGKPWSNTVAVIGFAD
jgi:hypothetical protein